MTAVRLYHGSKGGLVGPIAPTSRAQCDFGRGFYMGSEKTQPLTLVYGHPHAWFYELDLELDGLDVVQMDVSRDWALFVAFNRGKLEAARNTGLYRRCEQLERTADVIVGPIANDRMFVVLDRFFSGDVTDTALVRSLSALDLGRQYVAKTPRACEAITIASARELSDIEKDELALVSAQNRASGVSLANEICRRYRREGRYFDEILSEEANL